MPKEPKNILNPCGHRNSERVEALKKFPSGCPACLIERIAELEAQLEQHRWIPVTERLPENVATVFIFTGEGRGGVGFYGEDETGYIWERLDHAINLKITHWKPIYLPEKDLTNDKQ